MQRIDQQHNRREVREVNINKSRKVTSNNFLDEVVRAQKRGEARGIFSVCSAHPFVIEASLIHALDNGTQLLIESTCNQVNQFGGYTGMTPAEFVQYVRQLADKYHFPHDHIIYGGDHLGPSVWQHEPVRNAMDNACKLVRDCILAGYTKIHLDTSMKCADDPPDQPLDPVISARRAADLASAADQAFHQLGEGSPAPRYVIGTEVPPPGGIHGSEGELSITRIPDIEQTIEVTRQAFLERGLEEAWDQVIAVVVQPGVDFGDQVIFDYQTRKAVELSQFIERYDHLVYEVHSTDYQGRAALRSLVKDHFAILKVGPALTFAFREAVFTLAMIEEEILPGHKGIEISNIRNELEKAMLDKPGYWKKYYGGSPDDQLLARKYSFSDRSRYYWRVPAVQAALERLLANLNQNPIPLSLLSQYLPIQYERVKNQDLENQPVAIITDKIISVLSAYSYACGQQASG